MDPTTDGSLLEQTRRHFFGRLRRRARRDGPGLAARRRAGRAAAPPTGGRTRWRPSRRTSRPRAKSVIYLFMAGGPSQLELFDHKPELQKYNGQPIPDSFIKGKRFAFMDTFTKERAEAPGHDAQVRPARRVGRVGLGVPAAHRRGRRRPRRRPLGGDRRLQPRPGQAVRQHRLAAVRPAEHGGVGHLRHRQRVATTCPASSCCSPARAARAAARSTGAAASCRRPTRACRSASGGEPILNLASPQGIAADRQRRAIDAIRDLNRDAARRRPATPRSPRGSPPTRWPTGCRPAPRS